MKKLNLKLRAKESFIAGYNIKAGLNFIKESDILFEIDGFKIIKNNNIVHSISSIIACTGFINTINGMTDCIFVDDRYDILPDYVKDFFIYHEIGHIKNQHFKYNDVINKGASKYAFSRIFKLRQEEVEADEYSMNIIGEENAIKALDFLINNTKIGFTTKKELKLRRKELLKRKNC